MYGAQEKSIYVSSGGTWRQDATWKTEHVRWENNIKMDVEIRWENMDWINLAQNTDEWQADTR